jgi:hypothetical protein
MDRHGKNLSCKAGLRYDETNNASGAQTERRGDAGPVRGLLGGKASPAALFSLLGVLACLASPCSAPSAHLVVEKSGCIGTSRPSANASGAQTQRRAMPGR